MNCRINEINPIEMIRMTEKMNQQEFAVKHCFDNKAQYSHQTNNLTGIILRKVKDAYGRSQRWR